MLAALAARAAARSPERRAVLEQVARRCGDLARPEGLAGARHAHAWLTCAGAAAGPEEARRVTEAKTREERSGAAVAMAAKALEAEFDLEGERLRRGGLDELKRHQEEEEEEEEEMEMDYDDE